MIADHPLANSNTQVFVKVANLLGQVKIKRINKHEDTLLNNAEGSAGCFLAIRAGTAELVCLQHERLYCKQG